MSKYLKMREKEKKYIDKLPLKTKAILIATLTVMIGICLYAGRLLGPYIWNLLSPNPSYVWMPNYGWLNLNEGDVKINKLTGELSGCAWAPNLGLVNVTGVRADLKKSTVSGYAYAPNAGWINLNWSKIVK